MINNGLITTRSVDEFKKLEKLGEGTYGVVYKAQDRRSGRTFALKRLIMHNERKDGFPLTSLREIGILAQCRSHRHCVMLEGIATSTSAGVSSADSEAADTGCRGAGFSNVFLVFEYCEHDLSQLLRRTTEHQQQPLQSGKVGRGGFGGGQVFCPLFSEAQTKTVLRQLLSAVAFLHARNVVHRDIKPSNVLYTNKGEVKLADFGLARVIEAADYASYDSRVYKTRRPDRDGERDSVFVSSAVTDVLMTPIVTTLWYRAIEVLLGHTFRPRGTGAVAYGPAIDVWSCGCVFGELLGGTPLCPGDDDLSQTKCIFALLGPPTESQWPGLVNCRLVVDGTVDLGTTTSSAGGSCIPDLFPRLSSLGTSLLSGCLRYCPERRLTAQEALEHDYFRCSPFPVGAEFMPTFPVQILTPGTSSGSAGASSSGGGRARTAAGGGHSTAVAGRGGLGLGYGAVNPLKRKHEPGTSGRSSGEAGYKQAHRR